MNSLASTIAINGIVLAVFWTLLIWTIANPARREQFYRRTAVEWWIDALGLCAQGLLVPLMQIYLIGALLKFGLPSVQGILVLTPLPAFLLNFLAVDYLYYWNHRLFHSKALWPIHELHHTSTSLDVIATSRNALWTPVLTIYVWINGFFVFLLQDPFWYLVAAACTAALDLWRHSQYCPCKHRKIYDLFCMLFITPRDHAWHHSSDVFDRNFGANFNCWDRLHGTYYSSRTLEPKKFGVAEERKHLRYWFRPYAP